MIFIIRNKYLKKKAKKILPPCEYLIIDANDAGEKVSTRSEEGLNRTFSNVYTNGSFTPPAGLVRDLIDLENGENEKNVRKIEGKRDEFLESQDLTLAIVATINSLMAFDDPREANIFIVLPAKVYKTIGSELEKRMKKLFKTDFKFIFNEEDLDENKKLVKKSLKKKNIKELEKLVKENVKKYNLDGKKKDKDKDKKKSKKDKKKSLDKYFK